MAVIRNAGVEPEVIEYLKNPSDRDTLKSLVARAGLTVRAALRDKGALDEELGLGNNSLSDDALLVAMMAHPILIDRSLVVTPRCVRLCRPKERLLEILPGA